MAILADSHMHSSFSGDSEAKMNDMVESAIAKGLMAITFTEHMDYDFVYTEEEPEGFFEVNTDSYLYDLLRAREKYGAKIQINFGIELGMQTHINQKNVLYSNSYPFDFIIASSHLCNHKDPYLPEFFEGRDEKEGYHEYFKYIIDVVNSFWNYDVYGHLDYVLRYGPNKNKFFTMEEYGDEISEILKIIIHNGKGIEANTSGFHYGMGGPHPNIEILKRYKELGGEILTIGSDAHTPDRIGSHFKETAELLKSIGFETYCVFENREPSFFYL